ncbi:glycosyltransferase family 2 protein, partial [Patescibacteria group bacterium]|nr:glycosyltransferase family 2 protein [Patescibacteria group bacterium]
MTSIFSTIYYILMFFVVYAQVFLLITFLENRKKITINDKEIKLKDYPKVTVIVPCFNEEQNINVSIESLFALNYPQDKIDIFLIDDGSTDKTWSYIQKFEHHPNIKVFKKENGGKYTALNLGLDHAQSDFVGCLDADSVVDREALLRIMSYFELDPNVMAVVPSLVVDSPKGFLQNAQRVEYTMGIYLKKLFGFMGAIDVTPGPFTIFKKKVFIDLGQYRHAHNTEDMEIAYRMQVNNYKIDHCHDAYVFTKTPFTIKKLFIQRLRWQYGFINNTIDYKRFLFKKEHGNFSFFTLPLKVLSVLTLGFVFCRGLYTFGHFVADKVLEYQTIGFHGSVFPKNFDLFFFNTGITFFLTICVYSLVVFSIMMGKKMTKKTKEKWG